MSRIFPAKVLLFGEYAVLLGASALALPFARFYGEWKRGEGEGGWGERERAVLGRWLEHLRQMPAASGLPAHLNLESFERELAQGWHLRSNVPVGYGLGSSGVLCAAVYARYGNAGVQEPAELQGIFARMEAFFHGSSSGFDPLVSYLQKPLLKGKDLPPRPVEPAPFPVDTPLQLFLLDTGRGRSTQFWVARFRERLADERFAARCRELLVPLNQMAIRSFVRGDARSLWAHWRELSAFQARHFEEWIPESCRPLWQAGLQSGRFALKLCGAGGGGFLLGATQSPKTLHEELAGFRWMWLE